MLPQHQYPGRLPPRTGNSSGLPASITLPITTMTTTTTSSPIAIPKTLSAAGAAYIAGGMPAYNPIQAYNPVPASNSASSFMSTNTNNSSTSSLSLASVSAVSWSTTTTQSVPAAHAPSTAATVRIYNKNIISSRKNSSRTSYKDVDILERQFVV